MEGSWRELGIAPYVSPWLHFAGTAQGGQSSTPDTRHRNERPGNSYNSHKRSFEQSLQGLVS